MSLSTNFPTTRPSLLLDFVNSGQMDPRITFSRASGATWFNSAGTLIGVDSSTTSLTVGTGWQTLTLAATAGVDRGWTVGTSVQLSASTATNTMTGVVVSYTASTQTLVVSVASIVGSGTYATWQVSNLMPRLDYNPSTLAAQGLLIEEQRTNFFTNASGATGGSIGTGSVSGPDNALCRTFIPTAGSASFPNITGPTQTFTISLGQTVDWAVSGWFAAGPAGTPTLEPRVVLNVSVNGVSSFIYFELQLDTSNWTVRGKNIPAGGSEVSAPTITLFKPGLYRVTWVVRYTQDATGRNSIAASIQARTTAEVGTYTADGVSGVQYSLVQVETGSFVTSTIPTTTTALTRSADVASVNTLSPWWNSAAGTFYTEFSVPQLGRAGRLAAVDDGSLTNMVDMTVSATNGVAIEAVAAGVYGGFSSAVGSITANTTQKSAFTFSTSASETACLNAGTVGSGAVTLPSVSLTRLLLGRQSNGVELCGYLRRLTFYPRQLSNAELQAITA